MRLALIAFDGLDPRVIYKHRDKLPTFDSLMEESMHGKWNTPGHTIPSFTATLTGRQYNVCNFHWDDGKGAYQRHRQTGFDYLWEEVEASMTLLNMPVLYPPEDIDDAMVCGFLTPDNLVDSNLARPQEVQDMVPDGYMHDVHADSTYDSLGSGMVNKMNEMMEERTRFAEELIDKYDSDLFYGAWTAPDRWFHQCHLHDEDFLPMYEMVDQRLSDILDLIPDGVPTVVFSDHGFAHYPSDNQDAVHKGHMHDGFYCVNTESVPNYRDDSMSIFDLYPTVVNYLTGEAPEEMNGRIMFHSGEQDQQVEDRLSSLGYLE